MNVCHLLGRVITDPILEQVTDGRKICKFRMSTSNGKNRPPSRHSIVVWGKDIDDKHPENVQMYLRRGGKVQVTGRISESRWQAKDNGEWRSRTEIMATNIEFVELSPKPQEVIREENALTE